MALSVEGLSDPALRQNVQAHLPPAPPCGAGEARIEAWKRRARKAATDGLRALGYFQARQHWETQTPAAVADAACGGLRLHIDPGPPVHLARVAVEVQGEAADDPLFMEARENQAPRVGEILDQGAYTAFKGRLLDLSQRRGYFDARYLTHRVVVNEALTQADMALTLDSGMRYRFGPLTLHQDILDDAFLRRYAGIEAGAPFDADQLTRASQRLAASGYFADARVRQRREAIEDGAVPIDIALEPRKRMAYDFRAGFGTDTGARLRADVERRWVNRQGHVWNAGLQLAQRKQTLETRYGIPMHDPMTERVDLFAKLQREENDSLLSTNARAGAQYTRDYRGWKATVFNEFLFDRSQVVGEDQALSARFLLFGARASRREANDPIFPTRGWRLFAEVKGAQEALLSSTSLIQASVSAKALMSLGEGRLIGRADAGTTWARDFSLLPKTLRFFAGGDNSVRGYAFESLGPEDAQGKVIGGKHLLVVSAEYEYPLYQNWLGAAFIDGGNAFDTWNTGMKFGAGVGVRFKSPIGLVKIDLAWPLGENREFPRLHLGVGGDL